MNHVLNFYDFINESKSLEWIVVKESRNQKTNSVSFVDDEDPKLVQSDSSTIPYCDYYSDEDNESKSSFNFWEQQYSDYTPEEKEEFKRDILEKIDSDMEKIKGDYERWFSLPSTKNKIPKNKQGSIDELIEHIGSVRCILNIKPQKGSSEMVQRSWGYTPPPKPDPSDRFYINLYNFWNGKPSGETHVSTTLRHEMAHIADHFLKSKGIDAYTPTHDPKEYARIYLINDRDQYTRMQVLRKVIGAGPVDSPETMLNKFMKKVESGIISSRVFDFSSDIRAENVYLRLIPSDALSGAGTRSLPMGEDLEKRLKNAKQVYDTMLNKGGILYNDKEEYNIEQLFSNMAIIHKNYILIDFDSLSDLNKSMVDIDPNVFTKMGSENFA
jgi:hypothetical protein